MSSEESLPNVIEPSNDGPYSRSMLFVVARIILVLVAIPMVFVWAMQLASGQSVLVFLLESIAILGLLIFTKGPTVIRVGIIFAFFANVVAFYLTYSAPYQVKPIDFWPVHITLGLVCVMLFIESWTWVSRFEAANSTMRILIWGGIGLAILAYVVGVPVVNSVLEEPKEKGKYSAVQEVGLGTEIGSQAATFAMFAFFAYIGACLGSFLNVVAESLPQGRSISQRSSTCPKCNNEIQRIDNLPLFSYINLLGRCRSCDTRIPVRYLLVELVAAGIFGYLFLFELIDGVENVPSFKSYFHKGILWMILYPKWPAIGIYVFHVLFMCAILTLALIEWGQSKLRNPLLSLFLLIVFAASIVAYPVLQPVDTFAKVEQFEGVFPSDLNSYVDALLRVVCGLCVGAVVGLSFAFVMRAFSKQLVVAACALTGVVLGWQGFLQVAVLFCVVWCFVGVVPLLNRLLWKHSRLLTVWLGVVIVHHPFWKFISENWHVGWLGN